jgi:molybdenum-dependent DNA-binding transcriptional regulator ModE
MDIPSYKLNGRIWIEIDDEKLLGHGRVELLERIHASGSIRQAALQMKMSYKQAWDFKKRREGWRCGLAYAFWAGDYWAV